jgi:hypothetical protein
MQLTHKQRCCSVCAVGRLRQERTHGHCLLHCSGGALAGGTPSTSTHPHARGTRASHPCPIAGWIQQRSTHTHTHIQTDLDDRDQCSASRVQRTSNWAAASVVRTNALALAPDLPDLPDLTDLSVDSSQKQKRVQCDRQKSEHAVSTVKSPASRSLSVSLPAGLPRPR